MAEEVKISELPVAPGTAVTDLLEASQVDGSGWVSRSITVDQLKTLVLAAVPPPPPTTPTGPAGGDLAGTYPNPTIKTNVALSGSPTTTTQPTATNDTSIATTAYVKANLAGASVTIPAGSVAYGGTGGVVTGVLADFSWDTTNKRLGIGTAAPAYKFHVAVPTGDIFTVDNSGIISSSGGVNAVSATALLAGGDWWFGYHLGTGSGGYLGLFGGTGAPTLSTFGKYGSLYMDAASPGVPYYNNNGSTGWTRLAPITAVGTTAPVAPVDGQLWYYSDAVNGGGALYIRYNDGNTTQWVPASPAATPGSLIQTVFTETGAVATGTTILPFDDTIPQITEGDQYMTLAITPRSATSKLIIEVTIHLFNSVAGGGALTAALFQDATVNALAAGAVTAQVQLGLVSFRHVMVSGTTSATTFRVRGGGSAAGTTTFNGYAGARQFGGVMASSIVIQEVA